MPSKKRRRLSRTFTLSAEAIAALDVLATADNVPRSRWLDRAILNAQAQRNLESTVGVAPVSEPRARRRRRWWPFGSTGARP